MAHRPKSPRLPRLFASMAGFIVVTAFAPIARAQALPLKLVARQTRPEIRASDLMTRLYIFADDSMEGRQFRKAGNTKATAYLAAELKKLGLEPAGDSGTYFQIVRYERSWLDSTVTIAVGGTKLVPWVDFIADAQESRSLDSVPMVYGGGTRDSTTFINAEQAAGKVVLVLSNGDNFPYGERLRRAAAYLIVNGFDESWDSTWAKQLRNPYPTLVALSPSGKTLPPLVLRVTRRAAEAVAGRRLEEVAPGTVVGRVHGTVGFQRVPLPVPPHPGRNVVAILRGTDPARNQTYVALGAHNDHIGLAAGKYAVDHDSLRAWNLAARRLQLAVPDDARVRDSLQRLIVVDVDSLRRLRPGRRDSIANGADDDGSGSVAVLEIAEALAKLPVKPKRSVLFVFHTGEEPNMQGSRYFLMHPAVPPDSIIAQVNLDMIGRGSRGDTPEGGPDMLMAVGASRLATELGKLIEEVNTRKKHKLRLDYTWDAPSHPQDVYTRSDHYVYAQREIPVVFFFTGIHADYHQVTDEPQYIDYPHLTKITKYVYDVVLALGSRSARPAIDKPPVEVLP